MRAITTAMETAVVPSNYLIQITYLMWLVSCNICYYQTTPHHHPVMICYSVEKMMKNLIFYQKKWLCGELTLTESSPWKWGRRSLAKKASQIQVKLDPEEQWQIYSKTIKDIRLKNMEIQLKVAQWKNATKRVTQWPRKRAVSWFFITAGHDCLAKHLLHISILLSPDCILSYQHFVIDSAILTALSWIKR